MVGAGVWVLVGSCCSGTGVAVGTITVAGGTRVGVAVGVRVAVGVLVAVGVRVGVWVAVGAAVSAVGTDDGPAERRLGCAPTLRANPAVGVGSTRTSNGAQPLYVPLFVKVVMLTC